MRMSELAERTGVPVATIKYYLREGLLPPGAATSATQAHYDEGHVQRLQLVRVLREIGRVPVANIAAVLEAIDDSGLDLHDKIGTAHHALGPEPPEEPDDAHVEARDDVLAYVRARGWRVRDDAPSLDALAGVLLAFRELSGAPFGPDLFDRYAAAAEDLARYELDTIDATAGVDAAVTQAMVGTVVFEQALVALRRLAEEHFSAERFADDAVARKPLRRRPAPA